MTKDGKFTAGLDVGSRTTKAVIWDGSAIVSRILIATGWTPALSAEQAYYAALQAANVERIQRIVATGYGRVSAPFADETITEITAHARGVFHLLPDTRTLIDIGGQDAKAIILDEQGLVQDFAMNDRCAAGSGKFLEFLALTMELSIRNFAELAFSSQRPVQISSICTVFAESELLSLLAEGVPREDVANGVHRSIAWRVAQMAHSLNPAPPVAFSGGVANNRCMVRELSQVFRSDVQVPPEPEFAGA
ncbi:MAG: acyl-CoA dehydratase activase, partial [bacterium]